MISVTAVNFLKIRFFLAAMLFVFGRACRGSACSLSATSTLLNKDSVQQKVQADSLPHVVCLKCDPNGVMGFLGRGLDTSEQINHLSSVKTNLQYTVCTYIVIFNTTCPSCIVKKLTGSGGGEVLIESILCICKAWCYLKKKQQLASLVCHTAQVCTYDRMGLGFSKRLMQNESTGTEKVWGMSTTGRLVYDSYVVCVEFEMCFMLLVLIYKSLSVY